MKQSLEWQQVMFDGKGSALQAWGQPLENSEQLCCKISEQNHPDICMFPKNGHCTKMGVGLFGSGVDSALMWEEDPRCPALVRRRAMQGSILMGQEAEQRNGKRNCLTWYRCCCDLEVVLSMAEGRRCIFQNWCDIWGGFNFWRVQSTDTSSGPWDGVALMMCIYLYTARCTASLFLRVSYMTSEHSLLYTGVAKQAIYWWCK